MPLLAQAPDLVFQSALMQYQQSPQPISTAGMRARELPSVPLYWTVACRNLFHDRVRFAATLVGVVFSVVLVTVQLGLYVSCERMITAMIYHAKADLWVMPVNTKSFENTSMLSGHERVRALATNGVHETKELIARFAVWTRPDGGSTPVIVVGVDPQNPALVPWNMVAGGFGDLALPDGVIIDRSYMQSLGIAAVGDRAEIEKSTARVVAFTQGMRSFTNSPFVFTTLGRARKFFAEGENSSTYYLIGLEPGISAETVRAVLARKLGRVEILTSAEFRSRSLAQWLYRTGAGAALLGGAILGVIVGTVIVTQTLYASTKEHINEYATLRALGSSSLYLNKVILSQAFLSGLIGFTVSVVASLIIVAATADGPVPVVMTPLLTAAIFILTLCMCALSSLSAICIDPVVVFTR